MMEGEETGRGNQEGKEENTINKIKTKWKAVWTNDVP